MKSGADIQKPIDRLVADLRGDIPDRSLRIAKGENHVVESNGLQCRRVDARSRIQDIPDLAGKESGHQIAKQLSIEHRVDAVTFSFRGLGCVQIRYSTRIRRNQVVTCGIEHPKARCWRYDGLGIVEELFKASESGKKIRMRFAFGDSLQDRQKLLNRRDLGKSAQLVAIE